MLKRKERFCEPCYAMIKAGRVRLLYCAAQRLARGPDPPAEERLLLLERRALHRNQVAHHVAERREVILRLVDLATARKAQRGEVRLELDQGRFVGVSNGISTCIKCDRRLAGADEDAVVGVAERPRIGSSRSAREIAPGEGNSAVLRVQLLGGGNRLQE